MSNDFWDYMDSYNARTGPPPARPAPRLPKCGTTCHVQEKQQARLAAACCLAVIIFVTAVCLYWPHHHNPGMPWAPAPTGVSKIYPHNPGVGAAVVAGTARGAARVAGGAARWGFRGAVLGRRGGFYIPGTGGFHGYGLGIFGGF